MTNDIDVSTVPPPPSVSHGHATQSLWRNFIPALEYFKQFLGCESICLFWPQQADSDFFKDYFAFKWLTAIFSVLKIIVNVSGTDI